MADMQNKPDNDLKPVNSPPELNSMYRAAIETSADGFHLLDAEGRILEVNNAYVKRSGYSREELLTMRITDLEAKESPDETAARIRKVMNHGSDNFESLHRAKDGTMWQVEVTVTYWKIEKGRFFCFLRDITERKQAEQQVRDSGEKFRSIYENIGIGVALIGRDMQILSINPQMQKWFPHIDMKQQHICYQSFNTPPQESLCSYCPTVLTMEDGQVHTAVTDTPTPDGVRHYRIISTPLLTADGSIAAAIEMVEDITERMRTEQALREIKELFALVMRYSPIHVFIKEVTSTESRVLQASENFQEMIGIPGSAMAGKSMSELFPPEFAAKITADDWTVVSGGIVLKLEEQLNGRSYTTIKFPIVLGEKTLLAGYTIDISDRKRSEEALRQSEEFVRSILDTVDEGFIVIDRDYRILTANKAYCSQVGGCDEKVIGSYCYEISHKTSRPCFEEGEECATYQAFKTGTPHTALHRHKDARGNILYAETKAFPLKDASGVVTSVIEVINNVTEKYLLEDERLKTQKLESIGTLAGGIAHDFNNLLQGVFGYISMAKITHDQKEKSLAMLSQAEEALHMSVNLTTQLLTFSKGGKPLKKLIRLESTIENAVKFALSGSHTDYRMDIDSDLWSVEADAGQLAQVIQNIVLNANEAMAGRGTICISVRNIDIPANSGHLLTQGGQFVQIDIQDTGTGIPTKNLSKIFDPYFTTKQKGSGLGLATSYSIIRNHGGAIEVKSELNRGATFTIYLPASRSVETVPQATVSSAVGTRKGRILLMDDEDFVRDVAREMIIALGHEAEGAEDGRKAIELFSRAREIGRPFDLVILDLTVKGGMGGEEAIARIRDIDPHVKAVVSSGYADSAVVADYRAYGFSAVLNKPYRIDALQNCLNQCIT
ncbi:MAG: hypothetical protein C0402_01000 [Thermodesulfovibrio sp.]|nr:hypothetical protein [Thermodesulfovibrio sp.]